MLRFDATLGNLSYLSFLTPVNEDQHYGAKPGNEEEHCCTTAMATIPKRCNSNYKYLLFVTLLFITPEDCHKLCMQVRKNGQPPSKHESVEEGD